jgi:nitroimidazol reductase NimA-like FMN-containing flavoprotein (pyridoxamine 5'-phosphate oxidase superfamily)
MHLRQEDVGRVAVLVEDHPEIFPVNYVVDDAGDIFFRTDPGTKLDGVARAQTIAFEVDGIDEERQQGWSVLAVGEARWMADAEQIREIRRRLQPWAAGDKANVVRLHPTKLTGRRIYRPVTRQREDS